MKMYFAPLEGITGYVFRNAFHETFEKERSIIDKYFSPFISPGVNQPLTPKELRDIHPEHNRGMCLVPQILANNADDFLLAVKYIKELGYNEVNLNLGCPSGTVVSKRKGSGLLSEPDILESMLDKIYEKADVKVSIKTRIGKESPDEFPELMEIFNRFPVEELIVHPRIRSDFYKNTPNMEMFTYAYEHCGSPLCYNGDIVDKPAYENIINAYPDVKAVMIGRGFLHNPNLADELSGADKGEEHLHKKKQLIKVFHDRLLEGYTEVMSGEKPVLFKMKELWFYLISSFEEGDKLAKKIRKSEKLSQYREIVDKVWS